MIVCLAKTEGYDYLCPTNPSQCIVCKDYQQGKIPPMYGVPAHIIKVYIEEDYVSLHVRGPDTKDGYRVYPSIVFSP